MISAEKKYQFPTKIAQIHKIMKSKSLSSSIRTRQTADQSNHMYHSKAWTSATNVSWGLQISMLRDARGITNISGTQKDEKKECQKTAANRTANISPCHKMQGDFFSCLFCYCPLYALGRSCGGIKDGTKCCDAKKIAERGWRARKRGKKAASHRPKFSQYSPSLFLTLAFSCIFLHILSRKRQPGEGMERSWKKEKKRKKYTKI